MAEIERQTKRYPTDLTDAEWQEKQAREAAMKAAKDAGLLLIRAVGKTGLEVLNPDRKKLRPAKA